MELMHRHALPWPAMGHSQAAGSSSSLRGAASFCGEDVNREEGELGPVMQTETQLTSNCAPACARLCAGIYQQRGLAVPPPPAIQELNSSGIWKGFHIQCYLLLVCFVLFH